MNDLIILTLPCGRHVIIDVEDLPLVQSYRWRSIKPKPTADLWYAIGYQGKGTQKQQTTYMHRLIMQTPPKLEVDHGNHNGLDNRRANMSNVTHAVNCQNRRKPPAKIKPLRETVVTRKPLPPVLFETVAILQGVYRSPFTGEWHFRMMVPGGEIDNGGYDSEETAVEEFFNRYVLTHGDKPSRLTIFY